MHKYQNIRSKFILSICIILLIATQITKGQTVDHDLLKADSLYQSQKFTESYAIYESIINNNQKLSKAMLLKMAYIKEGLGDYTTAMIHLSQYQKLSNEDAVLNKLEKDALTHTLRGYQYDDAKLFNIIFRTYRTEILWILISLSITIVIINLYLYQKNNKIPQALGIIGGAVIILSLLTSNLTHKTIEGIIKTNHSYIMSAPSSGAEVIDILKKGHKVRILNKEDVWYKIRWIDNEVYIKENNLTVI